MKTIFLIIIILLLLNLYYMYSCSKTYERFESSITPEQLNVLTNLSPHLIAIKTLADLSDSLMKGSLTIPGGLNIQGPLTVSGALTVNEDTNLKKILTVDGNTNLKSKVIVGITPPPVIQPGGATLPPRNDILTVNGNTLLNKGLRVEEGTDIRKNLVVREGTSLEKNLIVVGDTTLNSRLTVKATTNLLSDVIASNSIRTPNVLIPHYSDINGTGVLLTNEKLVGTNGLIIKDSDPINKTGQLELYASNRRRQTGIYAVRHETNKDWLPGMREGGIDK